VEELVRETDRCRALVRAHSYAKAAEVAQEQIVDEGMEAELILPTGVLAHLRDRVQTWVETGRCEVFTVDSVPYGLLVLTRPSDTTACLLVYTEANELRGVLVNESEAAVEWAEETFATYKRRATPVSDETLSGPSESPSGRQS
jgi:predicted transcriptional regulator